MTAVIGVARSFRMRVAAEGVEAAEERVFLRARQWDEAQGHYFSRPVPAAQFADLPRTGIRAPDTWPPGRMPVESP